MSVVGGGAPGSRALLMGNEAIARGAVEAGVRVAAGYPGTPSSEIVEALAAAAKERGFYVEWSTNEKVAFEVAAGAALVGARSLVAMKNAGLNWVMDSLVTLAYTGVRGGMLVAVADDPAAHYSSTEQDTRTAAIYAELPCLEPQDPQEAKDMAREAFSLSERLELPVVLRSVTRLSHASGDVVLGDISAGPAPEPGFNRHWRAPYRWNVYGPPGAVKKHEWLHSRQPAMLEYAEASTQNQLDDVPGAAFGVAASGVGAAYAREALCALGLESRARFLKVGLVWPLPRHLVGRFLAGLERVIVIEEGDPVLEQGLALLARELRIAADIRGKIGGKVLPPWGELNIDLARGAIISGLKGLKAAPAAAGASGTGTTGATGATGDGADAAARAEAKREVGKLVAPRSSTLCAGCPHLGTYWALRQVVYRAGDGVPVINGVPVTNGVPVINGDIGCYEQAGYGLFSRAVAASDDASLRIKVKSPYEMLDTLYVMGSGIAMAQGQRRAGHDGPVLAVAGDSTYFHACMPALVNAVTNGTRVTFVVMDNRWTAMTGHQPSPATGATAMGGAAPALDVARVARALGMDLVLEVDPYDLEATRAALAGALACDGPALVVARRECALQVGRRKEKREVTTAVTAACTGCRTCLELGCPALTFDAAAKRAGVDRLLCVDCGLCRQVCPQGAIADSSASGDPTRGA